MEIRNVKEDCSKYPKKLKITEKAFKKNIPEKWKKSMFFSFILMMLTSSKVFGTTEVNFSGRIYFNTNCVCAKIY